MMLEPLPSKKKQQQRQHVNFCPVASTQPVNRLSTFHWDSPWREKIRVACAMVNEIGGGAVTGWTFLEPKCPDLEEDSIQKFQQHVNIRSIQCLQTVFEWWMVSICHLCFGFHFDLGHSLPSFHSLLCCPTCWSFLFTCAERYAWSCWSFALQLPPGLGGINNMQKGL